jgi:DNA mismatch repair protein MutL
MPDDAPPAPPRRIQLLSDHVCNKIAAGEVIERPASVFKELIENAIDAGADDIDIEILQGGRKAVIVTDNGCGMDRENALLSIERHATSKIRDVDDIEHIDTMGFRGEALAAIAAVSRFVLSTRRREDLAGTELLVEGGELRSVLDTGRPPGTTLEVRNLFHNVPARRKFLRSESTELANIRAMFRVFALAHPGIALRLRADGAELERYPSQTQLSERIADMYGDSFFAQLRPVDTHVGDLHIHGFAGLPTLHRADRRDQITLINRRPATAPILGYALREAYRDSLPRDRNAVVFLHLDMPPDWVDVNVHPTKREVRFGPSQLLRDSLLHALASALRDPSSASPAPLPPPPTTPPAALPPSLAPSKRQSEFPETYPPLPPPPLQPRFPPGPLPQQPPPAPAAPPSPSSPWKQARFLDVIDHRFCLLETEDGLVLMDPVAARERVLFERAKDEMDKQNVASQGLLMPETVACDPLEADRIRSHIDRFRELGFGIEPFGGDTFLVESVPAWLGDVDPGPTLRSLAREMDPSALRPHTPRELRDALARSCCRIAAEQSAHMPPDALRGLIDALARCRMPYTTPFGRPTLIHMGFRELRRKFGLET